MRLFLWALWSQRASRVPKSKMAPLADWANDRSVASRGEVTAAKLLQKPHREMTVQHCLMQGLRGGMCSFERQRGPHRLHRSCAEHDDHQAFLQPRSVFERQRGPHRINGRDYRKPVCLCQGAYASSDGTSSSRLIWSPSRGHTHSLATSGSNLAGPCGWTPHHPGLVPGLFGEPGSQDPPALLS